MIDDDMCVRVRVRESSRSDGRRSKNETKERTRGRC